MNTSASLAPCFINQGSVTNHIDMMRALDTVEALKYTQTVDGEAIAEGEATLVKLMADDESSTILVNSCLFLNVASFRYLTFSTTSDGACRFDLVGEGMTLTITPLDEAKLDGSTPARLMGRTDVGAPTLAAFEEEQDGE